MAGHYAVELTKTAQVTYERIYDEAQACLDKGDESNSKVKLLRMVDEAIDTLIPHDPFNSERALQGPLSNIFRVSKGRTRICYIGSSKLNKLFVLYISDTPRKSGDVHDPYAIFTRLVLSGKFDAVFSGLGIRVPKQPTAPAPRIQ
jgi:hypothetical protein